MENAAGTAYSGEAPGPKGLPLALADSESIPIRAPVSADVDDDEDEKESFGEFEEEPDGSKKSSTHADGEENEDEEEFFESATERMTEVGSPVSGAFLSHNMSSDNNNNNNNNSRVCPSLLPRISSISHSSSSSSLSDDSVSPNSVRPFAKVEGDEDEGLEGLEEGGFAKIPFVGKDLKMDETTKRDAVQGVSDGGGEVVEENKGLSDGFVGSDEGLQRSGVLGDSDDSEPKISHVFDSPNVTDVSKSPDLEGSVDKGDSVILDEKTVAGITSDMHDGSDFRNNAGSAPNEISEGVGADEEVPNSSSDITITDNGRAGHDLLAGEKQLLEGLDDKNIASKENEVSGVEDDSQKEARVEAKEVASPYDPLNLQNHASKRKEDKSDEIKEDNIKDYKLHVRTQSDKSVAENDSTVATEMPELGEQEKEKGSLVSEQKKESSAAEAADTAQSEGEPVELERSSNVFQTETERGHEEEEKIVIKEDTAMDSAEERVFSFESSFGDNRSILQRMVEEWDNEDEGEEEDVGQEVEEDEEDDEEEEEEEIVDPSAIAALMEAASSRGVMTGNPLVSSGSASFQNRPVGLGSSSLEPIPRVMHRSSAVVEEDNQNDGSEVDETEQKLQMIRVKFLRLVKRLGQTPQNGVVTQVLYRLGLAEGLKRGRTSNRAFNLDRATMIAENLEAQGQEDLDFTCNILILGKTGVGKSATINSLFDEVKSETNAFQSSTDKVREITGTIQGIGVRIIDTPGLLTAFKDQKKNRKIMASVKKFIGKRSPDIVLYFDRLDVQNRDYSDLPLLKIITETFGAAIWFNAIIVLTHASSAPPDGANGMPLSYEIFVAQRSHIVQHSIRQAAGDLRLMNPVSLVENHQACRRNRQGERVLPNGQVWKPQLLLLCFASKVLAEANALLKLQDTPPGKPSFFRSRAPPLPFLLSSLLQSHPPPKLPHEQYDDDMDSDDDLDQLSEIDSDDDFDLLPPFRHLSKSELSELDKRQRQEYFEELDQREKLFMKKQLKDELRRRKYMKKHKPSQAYAEEEDPSAVAMPLPEMTLPLSFDSDNPTYRYRGLDSQFLVRPVLDTHGWDHDVGYDGVNIEKTFAVRNKVPVSISGQLTKDKKELSLQFEGAASLKQGEHTIHQAGVDVHTVGRDFSYTFRGDTRFSNFKCNKTTLGLSLTRLGETLAYGMKMEDKLMIGRKLKIVASGGAMMGRKHVAYGGSVEVALNKEYPVGQPFTTIGLSVMNWHGDFAIGGNIQSQFKVGRKNMVVARANLNNRGSGQVTIRLSSNEHLQLGLVAMVPIIRSLLRRLQFDSDGAE
eukprot:TRINITY_DN1372_c0_g1_i1.p1 TRINITY_DN1372_c0_g1~~TRINITY_DN1372_c0_g1_i1.p1  ORF type:complete len:1308 (+),score=343.75 TRINITY_DN1372_c0_g1_i1:295-4218(+)